MAARSILDIQVNDAEFQRFNALFTKYTAALNKQPAQWAQVTNSIKNNAQGFQAVVNAIVAQTAVLAKVQTVQGRITAQTNQTAGAWKLIARTTTSVAANIQTITRDMLRWTGVGGAITGLLGIGSLWGLDRLAAGVTGTRRSALGLGIGYGEQQAFGPLFSRFLDPGAFLGGVSGALYDLSNPAWKGLMAAGIRPGTTDDAAQVGVQLLTRLPQMFANIPKNLRGTYAQSLGLGELGLNTQDINRLLGAQPGERAQMIKQFTGTAGALNLDPKSQKAWNDFLTTLDISSKKIETVFVKGLAPLAEPLAEVSSALADFIKTLLDQPELKTWMHDLGDAIHKFSIEVTTPEFKRGVLDFAHGIVRMAILIDHFVSRFGGGSVGDAASAYAEGGARGVLKYMVTPDNPVPGSLADHWKNFIYGGGKVSGSLLSMVRALEHSGDSAVSPAGAIGRYQIMPGTARQYGYEPSLLTRPDYNEMAAKTILADLVRKYHGNLNEVLVAYNAGPGRANRYRDSGDNPAVLPAETQAYLRRAGAMHGYQKVTIDINNNSGAQTTNSAVQLNQGGNN